VINPYEPNIDRIDDEEQMRRNREEQLREEQERLRRQEEERVRREDERTRQCFHP
jgi:trichohyalin